MQNSALFEQWWRLGGICGILFIVTFIIGSVVQGSTPSYGDATADVRSYFVDHGNKYLAGDFIYGLAVLLFFFPFASALRSLLGVAEAGVQMWSRLVFAGAVLFLAIAAAGGAMWTTLAFGNFAQTANDETINLLMALDVGSWHFIGAALFLLSSPAGLVIWQTKVLPTWLAALSLIYGVLALISLLAILADNPDDSVLGFIGFLGGAFWILITSIAMIMKKEAPVPATASTVM
jgi:hypothetical protein